MHFFFCCAAYDSQWIHQVKENGKWLSLQDSLNLSPRLYKLYVVSACRNMNYNHIYYMIPRISWRHSPSLGSLSWVFQLQQGLLPSPSATFLALLSSLSCSVFLMLHAHWPNGQSVPGSSSHFCRSILFWPSSLQPGSLLDPVVRGCCGLLSGLLATKHCFHCVWCFSSIFQYSVSSLGCSHDWEYTLDGLVWFILLASVSLVYFFR